MRVQRSLRWTAETMLEYEACHLLAVLLTRLAVASGDLAEKR